MSDFDKYSNEWILSLVMSTKGIRINPLRYRKPKWHDKLFSLAKSGLLCKKRYSCASFGFTITNKGREYWKERASR